MVQAMMPLRWTRARGWVVALAGVATFAAEFKPTRSQLVGGDGIALDEFLARPVAHWVQA